VGGVMDDGAGERLVVMLEARVSEFEKRMRRAEYTATGAYTKMRAGSKSATAQMERDALAASGRINAAMATVGSGVGNFAKGLVIGAAVAAMNEFAGAARNAVAEMADLADVADRVGISVEDFQGLQYGLKLAGVSADEATGSLQKFTDALGDAVAGQGALAERMKAAGIVLTDSNGAFRRRQAPPNAWRWSRMHLGAAARRWFWPCPRARRV
jgi:hypothetical protein